LKTAGWFIGAAGLVGLGVGGTFGVLAIGDKNDASCNSSNECQSGPLHSAKTAALIADIGLIGGGVLFAVGGALVLFAPGGGHASTGQVQVAPLVSTSGGGLSVAGRF
jgi:hypothetical protein